MMISNRDWVQLSSYLDGELDRQELQKIEERLSKEPGFQLALEELRQTKVTLQHTPILKVPRNFQLTSAMVGIKTAPRAVRGYQLASALMTFLLIGVLVLDFGRVFVNGSIAPAAPKEVMLEAFSDSAADALEEPALLEAEEEMVSDRAAVETDAGPPQDEESAAPPAAAEAVEEGEALGAAQEPEGKSAGEDVPDADLATNQVEEWQEDEVVAELVVPSQTLVPEPLRSDYFPDEEINRIERGPSSDPFRLLEIILGLGAISFGAAAWVIRRRKS